MVTDEQFLREFRAVDQTEFLTDEKIFEILNAFMGTQIEKLPCGATTCTVLNNLVRISKSTHNTMQSISTRVSAMYSKVYQNTVFFNRFAEQYIVLSCQPEPEQYIRSLQVVKHTDNVSPYLISSEQLVQNYLHFCGAKFQFSSQLYPQKYNQLESQLLQSFRAKSAVAKIGGAERRYIVGCLRSAQFLEQELAELDHILTTK